MKQQIFVTEIQKVKPICWLKLTCVLVLYLWFQFFNYISTPHALW